MHSWKLYGPVEEVAATMGQDNSADRAPRAQRSVSRSLAGRSSNLRIKGTFQELDQDVFFRNTFEYVANFFDASLQELRGRYPGIETDFAREDAAHFTAVIYRQGKERSRCRIWRGSRGTFPHGIAIALGAARDGAFNESLSVGNDGYSQFLQPLGLASFGAESPGQLTNQGAAELLWALFIDPLQQ